MTDTIKGKVYEYESMQFTMSKRARYASTPEGLSPGMRTCPSALFLGMGVTFMFSALTVKP